jgi:thioredoxin reductase
MTADPDVVIVGAGPSGLAAARKLLERRAGTIAVLDRDDGVGGLPRFCRHLGFGFEYSRRIESGPAFVRRLLRGLDSPNLRIATRTTALAIGPGPYVDVTGPQTGPQRLHPRAVLIATGIREMPRGGRLIPGDRPPTGILTTGQLQQMVARGVHQPLGRTVIVGSEHVAFSAVLTARHAGGRAIAIIEAGDRILSFAAAGLLAKYLYGVALYRRTTVCEILGRQRVEAVLLTGPEGTSTLACDSVLMTADWRPESAWLHGGEIDIDAGTGGPVIDQMMRTTQPGVFAAGNVLRGVESSGVVAVEGARAGACIAAYLNGDLPGGVGGTRIDPDQQFQYVVPQRWASNEQEPAGAPRLRPSLRTAADHDRAVTRLCAGGEIVWQSAVRRFFRGRRVSVSLTSLEQCDRLHGPVVVELISQK